MKLQLNQRQRQRVAALSRNRAVFAQDNRWITVKPNGPDNKGAPVQIDDQGRVLKGMGGKFNGEKISEVRKDFSGPKTPKEGRKAESPSAGLSEAHRSQIDPAKPKGDGITPEMRPQGAAQQAQPAQQPAAPESKPFDPKATTGIRKEDIARATAENEVAGFGAVGHANNGKSYIEIDPNNAKVGAKAVIFATEHQGRSGPATGTYKKLDTGMVITGVGQTYSTANGPRVRAYLSKPGEEAKPAPGPLMGTLPKPVAIMRETDKAYGVSNPAYEEAQALHEYGGDMEVMRRGRPAARTAWRERKSLIWVPKSQATAAGGEITSMSEWFANREGFSTNEAHERRDRAYEDGKARYAALIEQAKAAGVKGVRVGMKAATIKQKLRDAGHQTDSMDGRITDRQMARICALAARMKQ